MVTAAVKEKIKVGASRPIGDTEPLHMVGRLVRGTMSRVKAPALILSFTRRVIRSYWAAFWHGYTLPFKFRINNEIQKETLLGRVTFATTFIIVDSFVVMGKYFFKRRIPWEVIAIVAVIVAMADGIKAKDFTWVLFVPPVAMIGAVPFSVLRFRKWRGFRSVLKDKTAPIVEGEK
jgi:hypothetical protein